VGAFFLFVFMKHTKAIDKFVALLYNINKVQQKPLQYYVMEVVKWL